jgi:hypothetical protein
MRPQAISAGAAQAGAGLVTNEYSAFGARARHHFANGTLHFGV